MVVTPKFLDRLITEVVGGCLKSSSLGRSLLDGSKLLVFLGSENKFGDQYFPFSHPGLEVSMQ